MKPRPTARYLALLGLGAALLVAAVIMVRHNVPAPTDAGSVPVTVTSHVTVTGVPMSPESATPVPSSPSGGATISSPPASVSAPARQSVSPSRASRTGSTSPPSRSGAEASSAAGTPATNAPAVLSLPTLHVTARVEKVDSIKGVLQVPDDISRVGWWQHSVPPGSSVGSTVVDGHIDSATAGQGALFHLADLGPGDPITLTTNTGRTIRYQVQARRVYVKAAGLPADLFDQQGPARLVIISCGGAFDSSLHSYEDNVAIFATPVG